MTLNSDGPVGCLGVAKASQIGGSLRSGCTQALAYRLCELLLGGSPHGTKCGVLNSRVAGSSKHSSASCNLQNKKKAAVVYRRPSDG